MSDWIVSVRTAPREPDFLIPTLRSLIAAGWDHDFTHLYAEPETLVPLSAQDLVHNVSYWPRRQGNTRAAYLSFLHLAEEYPDRHIMLAEDDVQFSLGAREFIDQELHRASARHNRGIYSLYAHPKIRYLHRRPRRGWVRVPSKTFVGAQGIVFPYWIVPRVAMVLRRHLQHTPYGDKPADSRIGHIMDRILRWPIYIHVPGLCQHTGGDHSTLWNDNEPNRFSTLFTEDIRQWDGHGR